MRIALAPGTPKWAHWGQAIRGVIILFADSRPLLVRNPLRFNEFSERTSRVPIEWSFPSG